jgi:hypothetical protein
MAAPEAATCQSNSIFSGRHTEQWKSATWQSIQPRGRPYRMWQTRGIRTTTWQVTWHPYHTWQADQAGGDVEADCASKLTWANEWPLRGPVMGCHVAAGKCPMRDNNQISKKNIIIIHTAKYDNRSAISYQSAKLAAYLTFLAAVRQLSATVGNGCNQGCCERGAELVSRSINFQKFPGARVVRERFLYNT